MSDWASLDFGSTHSQQLGLGFKNELQSMMGPKEAVCVTSSVTPYTLRPGALTGSFG